MRIFLVATVVLGAVVFAPSPAFAVPVVTEVPSLVNADDFKIASYTCPAGRVIGMGGRTSDVDGNVVLTAIVVDATMTTVSVAGHARPGFGGVWSVTATVVCGPADVYGTERKVGANGGQGVAVASCEGGKILYSSGFMIHEPNGRQYVDHVVPSADLLSLAVHAGTTGIGPVTVAAFAICGFPTPDRLRIESATVQNANSPKRAEASANIPCGGIGLVLGGGAIINSSRPAFITGMGPNSTLDAAVARAAIAAPELQANGEARRSSVTVEEEWDLTAQGELIGAWC